MISADNEQVSVRPTPVPRFGRLLATKFNTMFVVMENLPNSFFPCGYIFVILCLSTHFTTDPPPPTPPFGFSSVLLTFCDPFCAGFSRPPAGSNFQFRTCCCKKYTFFVLVLDLKLLNLEASGHI